MFPNVMFPHPALPMIPCCGVVQLHQWTAIAGKQLTFLNKHKQ